MSLAGKAAELLAAAHAQTRHFVHYDAKYAVLPYPGGDVPPDRGVCADVVIRAYRGIGIDLQKLVHEDMTANFHLYPDLWGLKAPDPNIDHRRVPNLRVFFSRFGKSLPITHNPADYRPGDILTTRPITRPHIAIVSDVRAWFGSGNLMVIQNKGFGTRQDNELLSYEITGHYRYGV
ncbi:MAG: DUF1287 domain-containing protein [Asticcacaulis sp.]|uniref:DUF1287 domain-containing protein n=1 Tax=Asticcacaulis sp. TaxID=1872648 RepID=UPI0039E6AF31